MADILERSENIRVSSYFCIIVSSHLILQNYFRLMRPNKIETGRIVFFQFLGSMLSMHFHNIVCR